MDSRLQPYMATFGAAPAGESALVVYLDSADGHVIERSIVDQIEVRKRVRLMLRAGPVPLAYTVMAPDDRVVEEGGGFLRVFPQGKPYRAGILRFRSQDGRQIYSWQTGGATTKSDNYISVAGNYLGEINVDSGMSLEYLYYAKGHEDHERIAGFVERWYEMTRKSLQRR